MLWNFIEVAYRHGCSPVNLLHILRTPFPTNTSGLLLLITATFEKLTRNMKSCKAKSSQFLGLRARQPKNQGRSVGKINIIIFGSQDRYFFKKLYFAQQTQKKKPQFIIYYNNDKCFWVLVIYISFLYFVSFEKNLRTVASLSHLVECVKVNKITARFCQ